MSGLASLPAGPYSMAAPHYLDAGWRPLPLPAGKKHAPPDDWTGGSKLHSGEVPSRAQMASWSRDYPQGNIALSPPKTVLGIDVDAYDSKAGAQTLADAEEAWGQLPATWISTARPEADPNPRHLRTISGIRWFRIPPELAWPGKLPQGGGIELIRWDHRYAVVEPSIHPDTRAEYLWLAPDGSTDAGLFPAVSELPDLPEEWINGLTGGKPWIARTEADMDPEEVQQWIEDRGDHAMCSVMDRTMRRWLIEIRKAGGDGGAHQQMTDAIWSVVGDSAAGHKGLIKALTKLRAAFREATKLRRSDKEFASEWNRAKVGAVIKVAAEGEPEGEDLCELDVTSRAPKERRRVGSDDVYERNDTGNGKRFASRYRDSVRWVPALDNWFIWSDRLGIWAADTDGEAERMAKEAAGTIRQEAEFEEDPKVKASILKFATASGNQGKILSMLESAKANKGITLAAEQLNRNRSHLVATNGTLLLPIEFSGEDVRLIPSVQEHHNTIHSGVAYSPKAELPEWTKFMERFQPDVEVRNWLQKLAGYSLLGSNPRRLMVACIGDTSTGKSTFAEAIAGALGQYAGSANMTIFRDNQDDKARPDLLRVLPMRFVYTEEASRSWHLHPDQIKRITGGTPLTARGMRSNVYVDQVPAFTPWLITNHAPTIEGADAALWRRIVVVPFDVQIPKTEEDARFRERLSSPEGRAAILAWLVEGYRAYLTDPDSLQNIPVGAMAANAKFRAEISDLAVFVNEMCETGSREDPEFWTAPDDLYQAYQLWCGTNGVTGKDLLSGTKFGRELSGEYPKEMKRIDGKPRRVRVGIRVNSRISVG